LLGSCWHPEEEKIVFQSQQSNRIVQVIIIVFVCLLFWVFLNALITPVTKQPSTLVGRELYLPKQLQIDMKEITQSNKKVALYFFASWCSTCVSEYKTLLDDKSDTLWVGVLYYDHLNDAKKAFPDLDKRFALIFEDLDGEFALDWGVKGTPEILLFKDSKLLERSYRLEHS